MQESRVDSNTEDAELLAVESRLVGGRASSNMVSRRAAKMSVVAAVVVALLCVAAFGVFRVSSSSVASGGAALAGDEQAEALFESFPMTCRSEKRGTCHCNCKWADRRGLVVSGCAHDDGGCCHQCCCGRRDKQVELHDRQPAFLRHAYDCSAGYANSQAGWSQRKKAYCCKHVGNGCNDSQASSPLPYDCEAGVQNAQVGWSVEKKRWCCHTYRAGCQVTANSETRVTAPHHQHRDRIEDGQRVFTDSDSIPLPYNCNAGIENFIEGWSDEKKTWCCHTFGKGCFIDHDLGDHEYHRSQVEHYDHERSRFQHVTAESSYAYHHHVVDALADSFDCDAGYARRGSGWSPQKKQWCCLHRLQGCFDGDFPWLPWQIILGVLVACISCIAIVICCRESDRQGQSNSKFSPSFSKDEQRQHPVRTWYH